MPLRTAQGSVLTSLRVPQLKEPIVGSAEELCPRVVIADVTHCFAVAWERRKDAGEMAMCMWSSCMIITRVLSSHLVAHPGQTDDRPGVDPRNHRVQGRVYHGWGAGLTPCYTP